MGHDHALNVDRDSSRLEVQREVIDLSVARVNEVLNIPGNAVVGFDATDNLANLDLRFDAPTGDPFSLQHGRALRSDKGFTRIYLTNAAQAGKSLTMLVGDEPILALTPNVLDITGSAITFVTGSRLTFVTQVDKLVSVELVDAVTDIVNPVDVGAAIADHAGSGKFSIAFGATQTIATVAAGETWQFHLISETANDLTVGIGTAAPDANSFKMEINIEYIFRINGGGSGRPLKVHNSHGSSIRVIRYIAYRIR